MPSLVVGYGMAAVAVLFFGSNFVVTKSFPTGDGVYFNFFLAAAIFLTGLVYQIGICTLPNGDGSDSVCPQFEPFAMLGGAIWFIGNLCVVPIVQCIGLGALSRRATAAAFFLCPVRSSTPRRAPPLRRPRLVHLGFDQHARRLGVGALRHPGRDGGPAAHAPGAALRGRGHGRVRHADLFADQEQRGRRQ
jgi:hypothetical protein